MSSQTHARNPPSRGRKISQKKPYRSERQQTGGKSNQKSNQQSGGALEHFAKVVTTEIGAADYVNIMFTFENGTSLSDKGLDFGEDNELKNDEVSLAKKDGQLVKDLGMAGLNLSKLFENNLLDQLKTIYLANYAGDAYLDNQDATGDGLNVIVLPFVMAKQNVVGAVGDGDYIPESEYLYLLSHLNVHDTATNPTEQTFYSYDGSPTNLPTGAWRPLFCSYVSQTDQLAGFLNQSLAPPVGTRSDTASKCSKNLLHEILTKSCGLDIRDGFDANNLMDMGAGKKAFSIEIYKPKSTELNGAQRIIKKTHEYFPGDRTVLVVSFLLKADSVTNNPIQNTLIKVNADGSYDNDGKVHGSVAYVPIAKLDTDKMVSLKSGGDAGDSANGKETPYEWFHGLVNSEAVNLPKILQSTNGFQIDGAAHAAAQPVVDPDADPAPAGNE